MNKGIFLTVLAIFATMPSIAQDTLIISTDTALTQTPVPVIKTLQAGPLYQIKPAIDWPIIAVGTGWSIYAFTKIYSKDPSTPEQIMNLDENDIPKFDRWAAGMSNENADRISDYPFYGSLVLPFTLLFDKDIRADAGRVGMLFWEAMSITGIFYTGGVYFVDRYRPATYDESIPVNVRTGGNYKDAFPAGHPALVATASFFTAKVYADYHPESGFKYVYYGLAIAATGTTAYLRHIAGKHFPSDLLLGITFGTATGILVPQLHKTKRNPDMGFIPYFNGKDIGFAMRYLIR